MWEGAATYASGLRVPGAVGDFLILRDAYAGFRRRAPSAVPDHLMDEWVATSSGADTGIFAAPEGGAVAAAVPMLMEHGSHLPGRRGRPCSTPGSGLKYVGMTPID